MRKIVIEFLIITITGLLMISISDIFAQSYDTDTGYVIVRCTVAVSIDVLDTYATAYFNDDTDDVKSEVNNMKLGLNSEYVSVTSITVVNDSYGAITKWALWCSSIQVATSNSGDPESLTWQSDEGEGAWTLSGDDNNGICRAVLYAVFATEKPDLSDFQSTDIVPYNTNFDSPGSSTSTYKTGGDNFDPTNNSRRYQSALNNTSGTNYVLPLYPSSNYSHLASRGLWFKIKTPTAVVDDLPRRFIIRVRGGLKSAW